MSCFCAINVKEIEVTFSTPVTGFNNTDAVFGAGYNISDPTGTALGGTATIAKITDSKYKITTSIEMGLGEYTFKINKDVVTASDSTKNPLQYVKFQGSAGKDTTPPTISTATYNANAGEIIVNFSEGIKIASLDKTKFSVTDGATVVTLTANESAIASGNDAVVTFGLSTATKTAIAALGTTKTLSVQAGAVKDKADNSILAASGISLSPVAQLASSSFDASTNLLTLNFTKPVDVSTLTITQLALQSSAGSFGLTTADKIQTTVDGTSVVIKVADTTNTAAFKGASVTNRKVTLTENTTFKTPETEPQIVKTSTVAVTYTADTTKPALVSATYNTNGTLVLQFNKPVSVNTGVAVQASNWVTSGGTAVGSDTVLAAKMATTANGYSDTITYSAGGSSLSATNGQVLTSTSGIYFAKDLFVDAAGNKNVALSSATPIPVTYVDQAAPTLGTTATQISLTQVSVVFNKPVTTATAQTLANYTVKAPGAADLAVQSVQLQSDEKTAVITVASNAVIGVNYTITASNVTSKYGNVAIGTTNNTATWTAVTPSVTAGPAVTALKFVDVNSNYKVDEGDNLQLTYDQPIFVSGVTKDDFSLSASKVFGTGATFVAGTSSNQLVVTLGASTTVAFGTTITPVSTPHIKSLTGVNCTTTTAQTLTSPDATTPVIEKVVYDDTNASGSVDASDRVTLTFSKDMDRSVAASTILGVNALALSANVSVGTSPTAEWVDARTARITVGASANLNATAGKAYISTGAGTATFDAGAAATNVTDLWGNKLAAATAPVQLTSDDTTRPTMQSVTIAAAAPTGNLALGDQIKFTMSDAVNVDTTAAANELILYQGTTGVNQLGTTANAWSVSGNVVTYTVAAADTNIIGQSAQSISSVTVIGARAAKIMDASANTTVIPAGFGLQPVTVVQK